MPIELRPHQEEALKKLGDGKILAGEVGSGKTITAIEYYVRNHFPKDVYVITTSKKRDSLDWEEDFLNAAISKDPLLSKGKVMLIVDSWNNIGKYEHVRDAFFIFDEQRIVGSGSWVKSFLTIAKTNKWILLSGTPGDTWMEYIPVFLANGIYRNRTAFIREHVVFSRFSKFPKVDHYVNTEKLEKIRNYLLVDMPFVRHTKRHTNFIEVGFDKDLFKKVWVDKWHIYEDRPIRDIGELFIVARKLTNSHPSRLEAIEELIKKHNRLIIFYNFNYELEQLRTLKDKVSYPVAEWNGHKHEAVPTTDKWIYLVQYTAGAEGWNCVTTDAMAFYSLTYSYKIYEQAQGRTDRLNTPYIDLYYYVLRSRSLIDLAVWKALSTKHNFNKKGLRNEL